MPDIKNIVNEIYGLFENPEHIEFSQELFDKFGHELSAVVTNRFEPRELLEPHLRMSNIGRKDRQIWMDLNSKENKEGFRPDTLLKFMFGDLTESLLLLLARQAGYDVRDEQREVVVDGIKGHLDAVINGCVVDVKSASSFSFEKFKSRALLDPGNDPFGYVAQITGYWTALDEPDEGAGFLVLDKTLGKICFLHLTSAELRAYNVRGRIAHIKAIVASTNVPEKCYEDVPDGKSGNMKLATGCSYCPYKFNCWPDVKVYAYSSGPKFLTKVVREPRVDAVFD